MSFQWFSNTYFIITIFGVMLYQIMSLGGEKKKEERKTWQYHKHTSRTAIYFQISWFRLNLQTNRKVILLTLNLGYLREELILLIYLCHQALPWERVGHVRKMAFASLPPSCYGGQMPISPLFISHCKVSFKSVLVWKTGLW